MKKKYIIFGLSVFLLIVFDQISKMLVTSTLSKDGLILIPNFLKFLYTKNSGISFGMLSGNQIIIIILTVLIIIYLIYELINNINNKIVFISSVLIIGGALGNLIDRVIRTYVVDFISFTLFGKEMAIFNLADIFITFGVIIYFYNLLMEGKNERNSSRRRE